MSVINKLNLRIPKYPSLEEQIIEIEKFDGILKDAATVRYQGCNLLQDFCEEKASFERIGWLNLWSKTMIAIESSAVAYDKNLNWVLQTISRSTFEWNMHVYVIVEPIIKLNNSSKPNINKVVDLESVSEFSYKKIIERLRAYAAWCIWSDRDLNKKLLHPKTINELWDHTIEKKILSNSKIKELHERFFGKLDIETDEKILRQNRQEYLEKLRKKKVKLDLLLRDPQINKWSDKLDFAHKRRKQTSFFTLYDDQPSITRNLEKMRLRFAYSAYSKGSMALHGSSMEQFISISESEVFPIINGEGKGDKSLFEKIISDCNRNFVMLGSINHSILNDKKFK